jgi:hypothetical protein
MDPFGYAISLLQSFGIMDFLLPFMLVFTIMYAILLKVELFGDGDNKKMSIVVAIVLAFLFVLPHITGSYPLGYDPVNVINQALPSVSLIAIAVVMVMLIIGGFVGKTEMEQVGPYLAILCVIFVGYIFGSSLNWWGAPSNIFYWWTDQLTELLVIIAVFGAIVGYIVSGDGGTSGTSTTDASTTPKEKKA